MGHNPTKIIETSRSCDNYKRQDKIRTEPVSPWMLLQNHANNFPEGEKKGNFLTWPGLNNQQLLKHIPPSIETALGHMDQDRKNL